MKEAWHYECIKCARTEKQQIYAAMLKCPECGGWMVSAELAEMMPLSVAGVMENEKSHR